MSDTLLRSLVHRLRRAAQADVAGSDSELLRRWAVSRDQSAFELLVCRHGPLVWAVCRRLLSDRGDAEDAFQATFLLLVRKATTIRAGQALASWLHTVATRAALAARGRSLARPTLAPLDDIPVRPEADRDLAAVLDAEVARLPEKYRAAFVLCELLGLAQDEAARRLGCPAGTVASRLGRARQRLRKALASRGLAPAALPMAAVPAGLISSTLTAAQAWAVHPAASAALSPPAVALMMEVLQGMFVTKLKTAAVYGATILTLGICGFAGVNAYQDAPQDPTARNGASASNQTADDLAVLLEKARAAKIAAEEKVMHFEAAHKAAKAIAAQKAAEAGLAASGRRGASNGSNPSADTFRMAEMLRAALGDDNQLRQAERAVAAAKQTLHKAKGSLAVKYAQAMLRRAEADLEMAQLKAEEQKAQIERATNARLAEKNKQPSLEQRVETLEKTVRELEARLKSDPSQLGAPARRAGAVKP